MPSDALTDALREAYALAKVDENILDTFEIQNPSFTRENLQLQLCLIVDSSGSMQGIIDTVRGVLTQVSQDLSENFAEVMISVARYEETPVNLTGSNFVSVGEAVTALDSIIPDGGTEYAFDAVVDMVTSLPWNSSTLVSKAIFLLTDEPNEGGPFPEHKTQAEAITALNSRDITFFYGLDDAREDGENGFQALADATSGAFIDSEIPDEVRTELVDNLRNLRVIDGQESIFIVRGFEDLELTLETGEVQLFRAAAFNTKDPVKDEQGFADRTLSIDNTDREVTGFLESVAVENAQIPMIHRTYLRSDLSTPQGAPFRLFLSSAAAGLYEVSGQLSFADVVNKPASANYFNRSRFPSLRNR